MFFSLAFVPSMAVAVIFDENTVGSFVSFFLITFSVGLLLFAASKKDIDSLTIHDGFLVTVIFWVILGLLGQCHS